RYSYATLTAPNLATDLGRNEPQFRSIWGIIAARVSSSNKARGRSEISWFYRCLDDGFSYRWVRVFFYCLEALQRPVHPSVLPNEPEPLRPENRPVLVQLRPDAEPPVLVAPLGLTDPELNSPEILPPEMTNRSVLLPQGVPVATATQVPSKFP